MRCCVLTVREVLWPTPPKISFIWMPPSCGARRTHRANQTRLIFSGTYVVCSFLFLFFFFSVVGAFFSFFVSHTLFVSFVAWLFVSLLTLLLCGTVDSSLHHGHGFLVFLVLQFRPRGRHGLHQCDVPLHWQRSGSGGV